MAFAVYKCKLSLVKLNFQESLEKSLCMCACVRKGGKEKESGREREKERGPILKIILHLKK